MPEDGVEHMNRGLGKGWCIFVPLHEIAVIAHVVPPKNGTAIKVGLCVNVYARRRDIRSAAYACELSQPPPPVWLPSE